MTYTIIIKSSEQSIAVPTKNSVALEDLGFRSLNLITSNDMSLAYDKIPTENTIIINIMLIIIKISFRSYFYFNTVFLVFFALTSCASFSASIVAIINLTLVFSSRHF